MLDELPKLLDRNFVVGFFLPAALLASVAWLVLSQYGIDLTPSIDRLSSSIATATELLSVWLIAIALMALNFPLFRFLEGYGDLHPLRWRKKRMKSRYRQCALPALQLQAKIDNARASGLPEPSMPDDHPRRLRKAVEDFPDNEEWILPTRFGNRFRSLEVYSRVVYGIDAIPMWPRLQPVLPEQFRAGLAEAKARLDFCVNLTFIGWVPALLSFSLALCKWQSPHMLMPIISGIVSILTYALGLSAVNQYGLHVKSAFDLYRRDLATQLGLELPRSPASEREMWQMVSRMMIYRSAFRADQLIRFRPIPTRDL